MLRVLKYTVAQQCWNEMKFFLSIPKEISIIVYISILNDLCKHCTDIIQPQQHAAPDLVPNYLILRMFVFAKNLMFCKKCLLVKEALSILKAIVQKLLEGTLYVKHLYLQH